MEDIWKGEKVDRETSSAFVVVVASLDGRLGSIHGRSDGHSRQEHLDRLQDPIRESYAQSSVDVSVCGVPAGIEMSGQVYTAVRASQILWLNNFFSFCS